MLQAVPSSTKQYQAVPNRTKQYQIEPSSPSFFSLSFLLPGFDTVGGTGAVVVDGDVAHDLLHQRIFRDRRRGSVGLLELGTDLRHHCGEGCRCVSVKEYV